MLIAIGNIIEKEPDEIVPQIDIPKFIENRGFKVEVKKTFANRGASISNNKNYWQTIGFVKCPLCR